MPRTFKPDDDVSQRLVSGFIDNLLMYPTGEWRCLPDASLVARPRGRAAAIRKLFAAGYVYEKIGPYGGWVPASQAYAELPAAPVDLVELWQGDEHSPHVYWGSLKPAQKKTVIEAIRADSGRYRLLQLSRYWEAYSPRKAVPFALGGGAAAVAALGGWADFGGTAVTGPALLAHVAAKRRSDLVEKTVNEQLNWYLVEAGILRPGDETIPIGKAGLFHRTTGETPADWPAGLDGAADALEAKLVRVSRELSSVRRLQGAVAAVGGWDPFLTRYRAAIEAAVDAHLSKESPPADADRPPTDTQKEPG